MRAILKISPKQVKDSKIKGYEIASIPMKKLKTLDLLENKRWYLKDGFLILEATV